MDTIVALATPPGRSAIGVIRLSGPESLEITKCLVGKSEFAPLPGQVVLRKIQADANNVIDTSLLTYFQAPHSYTGEDVVEISCHGSPVVLRQVIDQILKLGGRLAGPGEFTLRALKSGKLNLSQAEAIRDLINAQTVVAAQQALRQLKGELSARLQGAEKKMLGIIVLLESALEFVEDDLPDVSRQAIRKTLRELVSDLEKLAGSFDVGHLLRDGVKVTIVGRPNVGKSSIFNRLLAVARSIVTEVPGTTRDTITEALSLDGLPVLLTDTAGVRDSPDQIEREGVKRAQQKIADADMLLVVLDGSMDLQAEDFEVLTLAQGRRHIVARNKSDAPAFSSEITINGSPTRNVINVSAVTGDGLSEVRAAIMELFGSVTEAESGLVITDARHYDLLERAIAVVESSMMLMDKNASEELVLVGLHDGLRFLGEITGETTTEEILSEIFATFCIGK
jgi:tRNA modification GTPase